MKVTVLTSKENLVWISMNEIIPWIERLWVSWGKTRGHEVEVIYVENKNFSSVMPTLMQSDLVVITSFTTSLAGLIWIAKKKLSIPLNLVVYLHNQASIACWPYFRWRMGEVITTQDVLVGSCSRDKASMDVSFINAQVYIHPFSIDGYSHHVPELARAPLAHFVFIGRISPQKNLHTAIWAFSLLNQRYPDWKWKFELFGEEDHLGSPLMGIENNDYLSFLKNLLKELRLEDKVIFRGFLDRNEIQKELATYQRIFLAPSLHSDENFGMATFRCLSQGHKSLLSDWGGHADYASHFPETLSLVKVHEGPAGPFIEAGELAESLKEIADRNSQHKINPSYYEESSILKSLDDIVAHQTEQIEPLVRNEFGERIQDNRAYFHAVELEAKKDTPHKVRGGRIFESFEDQDSFPLFRAYGMTIFPRNPKNRAVSIAPWVCMNGNKLDIYDPMKGRIKFTGPEESVNEWLINRGYASEF